MKTKLSTTFITVICLALLSCNNADSTNSEEKNLSSIENVISNISKDPDTKGGNKCLLDYQTKYDQLLSEEDVLNITGFVKEKLTTEYVKPLKDPKYHLYYMGFDNGRMQKSPVSDRLLDQKDVIKIQGIEEMSLNSFNYNFTAPKEKGTQTTEEIFEDVVDGKIKDDNAEKLVKKLEENNVSKEQIKETGGGLINAFSKITEAYVKVDNLGDAASWNTKNFELVVLKDGVKFGIEANVSDDVERNKEVAISLAKIILDKCK